MFRANAAGKGATTCPPPPPPSGSHGARRCADIGHLVVRQPRQRREDGGSHVRVEWGGGRLRGAAMHLQKPATRAQNPAVSAIPSLHTLSVVLQSAPVQHTVWYFPPRAHQRVTFCRCTRGVRPSASCPYTHASRGRAGTRGCVRARACVCTCARIHMYVGLPSKGDKTKKYTLGAGGARTSGMVSTCWAALAWDWSTSAPACAGQLGPSRPNRRAGAAQPPTAG
eukprot:gene12873-biopygen21517